MMLEAVRLFIWDLDETFWQGTLADGGIDAAGHAAEIVTTLARRGIMSSICSKNDSERATDWLKRLDV
jgi:predicted enzyme involved in methoxymalonyl-ACP biosynthesis